MGTRRVAFVHTSPAAVAPTTAFYAAEAPDVEVCNLLDDGLLRLLRAGQQREVAARLLRTIRDAASDYGVEAALLTCSAIDTAGMQALRAEAGVPVVKVDEAMARQAVALGRRLGVVVTFAGTREPTTALLLDAARAAGVVISLREEVVPAAYDALLAGELARHDAEVLAAVQRLAVAGAEVVVLAQVSMARVLGAAEAAVAVPIVSSLRGSLEDLRAALGPAPPGARAGGRAAT